MRRFAWVLALAAAVSIDGCAGAGSVLGTADRTTANQVVITVLGSTNVPRVLPGATIALSATATIGAQNGVSPIGAFVWSATLVSGGSYVANASGGTKPCQAVTVTSGGTTQPYTTDFSLYLTIDPTNEANVLFSPPPQIPAPAGATLATSYPYCVRIAANAMTGPAGHQTVAAGGSMLVAVVDPLAPEQ